MTPTTRVGRTGQHPVSMGSAGWYLEDMPDAVALLQVLAELGAIDLALHRTDGVLAVAVRP